MPAPQGRRARIAMMLESDGLGGAEVLVLRLSEELERRGHYVMPVGPANGEGWLAARYRESGFEPQTFNLRWTLDPGCVTGLKRLFREHSIDVVHSHEFTMAVYGAAAARSLRLRHVVTMHGSQSVTRALRRRIALRWAFRNSHATVTISDDTRRQMCQELGIAETEVGVILNGVPDVPGDATPVIRELDLRADEIVLLAVGNLDARKAHIVLLQAMDKLQSRGLNVPWRIVIAGGRGGGERENLLRFAREHKMDSRLNILTHRNDIANMLAAATIFVMPSLWEGLPLAILEAMLAGKPVVASGVAGIPEAVVEGMTGLLVPPGDADALATALDRLIRDPALNARLGAAARRVALERFTISAMADQYERLYLGA